MQKKIRLYYNSSERDMSVFLKYFFEMVGIYVHEELMDIDDQCLLDELSKICKNTLPDYTFEGVQSNIEYDANIFYITTTGKLEDTLYNVLYEQLENALNDFLKNIPKHQLKDISDGECEKFRYRVLRGILSDKQTIIITNQKSSNDTIVYGENNFEFLDAILDCFLRRNIISEDEYNQLKTCAKIYYENKFWELTLQSKYFFADSRNYDRVKDAYLRLVKQLLNTLKKNRSSVLWGSRGQEYLQYSTLKMLYDINEHCVKNGEPVMYRTGDQKKILNSLLEKNNFNCLEDSLHILMGDLYYHRFSDANRAAQEYLAVIDSADYNKTGCIRMGDYWKNYGYDDAQASQYYAWGIECNPTDFSVWYRLGQCFFRMCEYSVAFAALGIVIDILSSRIHNNVISPLEIDCLFNAHAMRAFIANKLFRKQNVSLHENYRAIDAYNITQTSQFYHLLGAEQDVYRNIVRSNLNVDKIYYEINKLQEKMKIK